MEKEYPVCSGNEQIGTALVERCGLYYRIQCRCALTGDVPYKIIMLCGEKQADLGICVPQDGCFGLETRIPIKRIGEGEYQFRVKPRHNTPAGMFVTVSTDEPFRYLSQLGAAHMERRNGELGIVITES